MTILLALAVAALPANGPGRPLFDWGARPAALVVEVPAEAETGALVREVHLAADAGDLLVRFTFDRPVRDAMLTASGDPVSGRLRAMLYWDADEDTRTGLDLGRRDQRTGAEFRLEVGVAALGEDREEGRPARALVLAALYALTAGGRERIQWRTDEDAAPAALSWRDTWIELRLPAAALKRVPSGRVILAQAGSTCVGRVAP